MIDYSLLNNQLRELLKGERNTVGMLANAAALLKDASGWFWVGFYIVHGNELWLGPFQGSPACFTIGKGKGVCGTAWETSSTIVVPDVELFEGHIACSSESRSEIVVPLRKNATIVGVLDIDSRETDTFTEHDRRGLEEFCTILMENVNFD